MKNYRIQVLGKFRNYISQGLHGVVEGTIKNGWMCDRIELQNLGPNTPRELTDHLLSIREQIGRFKPHILFTHAIFGSGGEVIPEIASMLARVRKHLGTVVLYHMGDLKGEPRYPKDISKYVDAGMVSIGDEAVLTRYEEVWKVPCYFWPYGVWGLNEMPTNKQYPLDLVFTGNRSTSKVYQERTKFIQACRESKVYKFSWFPEPDEVKVLGRTQFITADISSSANAVLNVPVDTDLELYMPGRTFQYAGSGALTIQLRLPGYDRLFVDGEHVVFIDRMAVHEVEAAYTYFVKDYPEEGEKIRRAGFEYCQKHHNYKNRMRDLVDIVEGKRDRARVFPEDF